MDRRDAALRLTGTGRATGAGRDWSAATAVVEALGGAGFGAALLRAATCLAAVDHLSLFGFDPVPAPRLLLTASSGHSRVAAEAGRRYEAGGYHRFDPNLGVLRAGATPASGVAPGTPRKGPLLLRLAAEAVPDGGYRKTIYERYDLGERLSLIDRVRGQWLILNLYRARRRGPCPEDEAGRLADGGRFLLAAAGRHLEIAGPPDASDAPRRAGVDGDGTRPAESLAPLERVLAAERLSRREVQVCARALIGMTNLGIALELGVKESTVATLRRRAYGKLGISSLQELFLLCLRRLAAGDDPAPRDRAS